MLETIAVMLGRPGLEILPAKVKVEVISAEAVPRRAKLRGAWPGTRADWWDPNPTGFPFQGS